MAITFRGGPMDGHTTDDQPGGGGDMMSRLTGGLTGTTGTPDSGDTGPTDQRLKDALNEIRSLVNATDFTDQDRLILEQMTTLGQRLLAQLDKEKQAALGGGPATNYLRRASG